MDKAELLELFKQNGFDEETVHFAEAGHKYWREHKFEKEPRLQKVHLEATPTFWNMNGSAMDLFLMTAKGIVLEWRARAEQKRSESGKV